MKKLIILKFLLLILLFQTSLFAQKKASITIACNSANNANETAANNLEFNNIKYVADRNGTEKAAIKFSGESFIKVNKNINPETLAKLTVAFWAKPDFDNKRMTLFSQDDGGYDRSIAIDERFGGGWKWSAFCGAPLGGAIVSKNKWSFVAVVFNQSENKVLIFVDGKFYEREGSSDSGLEYFHFGNNPSYGEAYFGLMDDIKIYDDALTREEISALFKAEGGKLDNSDQYHYAENTGNAAIEVRVGDVDNLGFGWETGFDPFCGQNTHVHNYPWKTDENDHPGTDKIMVVSSYTSKSADGYTSGTKRPENQPVEIKIKYKKPTIPINSVVIQMMLDDFQAPVWGTSFQFHINGKRLTYIEDIINELKQTGPIGKLVQVGVLPEDNNLFETGNISIKIDDPVTGAGDGFAIDFVQLLINPIGEYKCIGNITGTVKDETGKSIKDALVSANGLKETVSTADGKFTLQDVPIGIITASAGKSGYSSASESFELKKDEDKAIKLVLKKKTSESVGFLSEELKAKGFVNLYGIHFDSGKDVPKPSSEPTLNELAKFLKSNPGMKIEIIGHTDADGDAASNKDLSYRRAKSVIAKLKAKGVNTTNLKPTGMGEINPVASNKTASGKALNRRVEVKVI
jgi:OmpA-OmpF porin, OOP family